MNDELKARIEAIKESCRQTIALAEQATPGPWFSELVVSGERYVVFDLEEAYTSDEMLPQDADLIAHARNTAAKQATALLTAIEALETLYWSITGQFSSDAIVLSKRAKRCLEQIAREWEDSK